MKFLGLALESLAVAGGMLVAIVLCAGVISLLLTFALLFLALGLPSAVCWLFNAPGRWIERRRS